MGVDTLYNKDDLEAQKSLCQHSLQSGAQMWSLFFSFAKRISKLSVFNNKLNGRCFFDLQGKALFIWVS
jgi:hypothetical protein